MKRCLAFFGAFNPPTLAHLELARFALARTGREEAVFVPSKSAYIREDQGKDFAYADAQRLRMLRAAAESRPWMRVTDWELRQETQPRTYFTLCALRARGLEAALLMGSDKLKELSTGWRYVEDIVREFGIVCLARGEDDCEAIIAADPLLRRLSFGIQLLRTPETFRNVSSTAVRRCVAQIRALRRELGGMAPREILPLLEQDGFSP